MVNGCRRKTAARPWLNSLRARAGWQGISGLRVRLYTNTLFILLLTSWRLRACWPRRAVTVSSPGSQRLFSLMVGGIPHPTVSTSASERRAGEAPGGESFSLHFASSAPKGGLVKFPVVPRRSGWPMGATRRRLDVQLEAVGRGGTLRLSGFDAHGGTSKTGRYGVQLWTIRDDLANPVYAQRVKSPGSGLGELHLARARQSHAQPSVKQLPSA
jgi:hypothetical protein